MLYGFTEYAIYTAGASATGVQVYNNIFSATGTNILMSQMTSGVVSDYNLYYAPSTTRWDWNGGAVGSFAGLQAASGQEAHSLNVAPQFASATPSFASDFRLSASSPAIHAGTFIAIEPDYAGVTMDNPPSLGAYSGTTRTYRVNSLRVNRITTR